SSEPVASAARFKEDLIKYGMAPENISVVRLAVKDDRSTDDIDESSWRGNADNLHEIEKISSAGAIWITGGDQLRLTNMLIDEDGADSPMLTALRARLSEGAVVGGTSAGAAIMSRLMIAGGDSLAALTEPVTPIGAPINEETDGPGLLAAMGLGFLPLGVVDQHFDQRARLGRLARAISLVNADQRVGIGVDEDTAFVVDLSDMTARVVGTASVTIIDGRDAKFSGSKSFSAQDVGLHVLSDGDEIALSSFHLTPSAYKKPTVGDEYYAAEVQSGGGVAIPYAGIGAMLGSQLLDNKHGKKLSAVSFREDGRGVRYVFVQDRAARGYWGRDASHEGRYTIDDVKFSISPVTIEISPVNDEVE
ncbi:MAG: cyanophycinase, partial [Pseudomonadota bacterium]